MFFLFLLNGSDGISERMTGSMKGAGEIVFIERICRDETSFCSNKYVPRLPISLEEEDEKHHRG